MIQQIFEFFPFVLNISNSGWYNNISHDKLSSHFWVHMFSFFRKSFILFFLFFNFTQHAFWEKLSLKCSSCLESRLFWLVEIKRCRKAINVFVLVTFDRKTYFQIAIYVNEKMLNKTITCAPPYTIHHQMNGMVRKRQKVTHKKSWTFNAREMHKQDNIAINKWSMNSWRDVTSMNSSKYQITVHNAPCRK